MNTKSTSGNAFTTVGLLLIASGYFSACGDSSFKGSTPRKPSLEAKPASEKVLNVACSGTNGEATLVTDLSGTARDLFKIEGEFCQLPATEGKTGELDIVFSIDFSGSMKQNDPGTGSSCGRLAAANAIYNKLKGSIPTGAKVRVGVVGFDTLSKTKVPMTSLDSFGTSLTYANFCDQNSNGYTNYAAAFDATRTILGDSKGNKTVYLISDGMPTVGGGLFETPHSAGLKAADKLKAEIKDLVLNAVFLGAKADPLDPSAPEEDPKTYLEKITGSPDRVRLVENAEAIASQIVTFEDPVVPTMDTASVTGKISAPGFSERDLKVAKFEQDAACKGVWKFATESFKLETASGKAVSNLVTLRVKSSDGKERVATATINFTAKE